MALFRPDTVGERHLRLDKYGIAENHLLDSRTITYLINTLEPSLTSDLTSAGGTSLITDGTGPTLQIVGVADTSSLKSTVSATTVTFDNTCLRIRDTGGNIPPTVDSALASGTPSVAVGPSSSATMANSVGVGVDSDATASGSVGAGYLAKASGLNSVALGSDAAASGADSVAVGNQVTSQSNSSTAIGVQADAVGDFSVAVGSLARTYDTNAIGIGNSQAAMQGAICLGNNSRVGDLPLPSTKGLQGIVVGGSSVCEGDYSATIGYSLTNTDDNTLLFGSNAVKYQRMMDLVSVTQLVSNATAVTCNSTLGSITMFGNLAAGASQAFTVNNTFCKATSVVLATISGIGGTCVVNTLNIAAGSFAFRVMNVDVAPLTPIIQFQVLYSN